VKVAIKDANVLIDLEIAELFDLWFQLGHETLTTELIVGEIRKGSHRRALEYIDAGHIRVAKCSPSFLEQSVRLQRDVGPGPSIADCTGLLLAIQENAMLLSGSMSLRVAASTQQVEMHDTLWIFDQLITNSLMNKAIAAKKLEQLMRNDKYLANGECISKVSAWMT